MQSIFQTNPNLVDMETEVVCEAIAAAEGVVHARKDTWPQPYDQSCKSELTFAHVKLVKCV